MSEYVQYVGRGGRGGCDIYAHVLLPVVNEVELDTKKHQTDLTDLAFPFIEEELRLIVTISEIHIPRIE